MEMMRDGDYSVWATEAAAATGLPVWIGIAVEQDDDGRPHRFRPSELAARGFRRRRCCELLAPAMVSVMHTSPHVTAPALEIVRRHWRGSLGAYAESGYFAMPDWQFVDIIPEAEYVDLARAVDRCSRPGHDRRLLRDRPVAHRRAARGVQVIATRRRRR